MPQAQHMATYACLQPLEPMQKRNKAPPISKFSI